MQIIDVEMQDVKIVGALPDLVEHDHHVGDCIPNVRIKAQRSRRAGDELGRRWEPPGRRRGRCRDSFDDPSRLHVAGGPSDRRLELGLEVVHPSAALRERLDSKIVTTQLGNEAGVPSVPNVLGRAGSYDGSKRRHVSHSRRARPGNPSFA